MTKVKAVSKIRGAVLWRLEEIAGSLALGLKAGMRHIKGVLKCRAYLVRCYERSFKSLPLRLKQFYRVTQAVADLGWDDLSFDIPLSA